MTLAANGTVEVGAGGTVGQGTDDGIVMNGGTLTGAASSTWTADIEVPTGTSSTISINPGVAVTQTRDFGGAGALTKTGPGTFAVNSGVLGSYEGDSLFLRESCKLQANQLLPDSSQLLRAETSRAEPPPLPAAGQLTVLLSNQGRPRPSASAGLPLTAWPSSERMPSR